MQPHHAFKPLVAAAVGAWLTLGAATASAQMLPQTADMAVTGTIVPAACSASFAGGGVVDFGTIKVADLPDNAAYGLGGRDTALTVSCASTKRVYFSAVDLQSASKVTGADMQAVLGSAATFLYGLGTGAVNGTPTNLGSYVVEMPRGTIDGTSTMIVYSNDNGATWGGGGSLDHLLANGSVLYSMGGVLVPPTRGRVFNFPLRIVAALDRGSRLQVAQDTPLNGQLVFSIRYE